MFSFIDIQDSLPNINGVEVFNKLFKKSQSALSDSMGTSVHNVWLIPGHIIISIDEGHKVLAFDLLIKPKPWPDIIDFLNTKHAHRRKGHKLSALEVFSFGSVSSLLLLIVMKSSEVHIWKFLRPAFEWSFVSSLTLSIGKNVQIMSVCFDAKSRMLFWCERRTPTQCCVCSGKINVENEQVILKDKSDILHNCPPVQLSIVGTGSVLLKPTANCPVGLTMFWSAACKRIQLHIWNYSSNRVLPLSESLDFQKLVTDSISLWINNCPNDPAAVAYCTHPVTQELLILESTYSLFSVTIQSDGKPIFKKLCRLNNFNKKSCELNQRKTYRLLAFQRFVALLLEDDEFFVFETYKGMLVWSTDSLKSERPRIWVSQGVIPRVGVWNQSQVQVLRSESIIKQCESMLKISAKEAQDESQKARKMSKEHSFLINFNNSNGKSKVNDHVSDKMQNNHKESKEKISTSHNQSEDSTEPRASSDSLVLISEYLRDWNTKNMSSEISLWLLKHPKFNVNINWLQVKNGEEFKRICQIFDNPCILLALLYNDTKCRQYIVPMIKDYVNHHVKEAIGNREPEVLPYLKKFSSLADDIYSILESVAGNLNRLSNGQLGTWREMLTSLLRDDNLVKKDFYEIMQWASELQPLEFIKEILSILGIHSTENAEETEVCNVSDEALKTTLLRAMLRSDTKTLELVSVSLWRTTPWLLPRFLEKISLSIATSESRGFLRSSFSRSAVVSLTEINDRILRVLQFHLNKTEMNDEQLKVLTELMMLSDRPDSVVQACKLYLECGWHEHAIRVLESHADDSNLHYRLFFCILSALIKFNLTDRYSEVLSKHIPSDFLLPEFCHIVRGCEDKSLPNNVFAEKDTSLGDLEPLLKELINQHS